MLLRPPKHKSGFYVRQQPLHRHDKQPQRRRFRRSSQSGFFAAFERAVVDSLRFRKRGKLNRSGQLTIDKETHDWLRAEHGLSRKWTEGTRLLESGALPTTRIYQGNWAVTIRSGSFLVKVRRKQPISYQTIGSQRGGNCSGHVNNNLIAAIPRESFLFDFKFFKREFAL